MRVAIFVAVVAAHVIVFLLFPSLWRRVPQGRAEELSLVPISLITRSRPQPGSPAPQDELAQQHPGAPQQGPAEPADQQQATPEPTPGLTQETPDWRAQAAATAQLNAQHIVEAEDAAARRSNALMARIKPLAPSRVQGPQFGWDYTGSHRLVPLPQGGFAIPINEHCQLLVLPLPFFGCSIGKIKANGDLFKYLHPPVKFGDWDKRDEDP